MPTRRCSARSPRARARAFPVLVLLDSDEAPRWPVAIRRWPRCCEERPSAIARATLTLARELRPQSESPEAAVRFLRRSRQRASARIAPRGRHVRRSAMHAPDARAGCGMIFHTVAEGASALGDAAPHELAVPGAPPSRRRAKGARMRVPVQSHRAGGPRPRSRRPSSICVPSTRRVCGASRARVAT